MIKKNQRLLNIFNVISDFIILFISYLMATYIRFFYMYLMHEAKAPNLGLVWGTNYLTAAYIFAFFEIILFYLFNVYSLKYRQRQTVRIIIRIAEIGILAILILIAFLYITLIVDFSRIAIAIYYVISTCLLALKRILISLILKNNRKKGYNQKHVIVIGNGKHAREYIDAIHENKDLGYTVDGYVSKFKKNININCLGSYEDLESILDKNIYDEVMVALESHEAVYMPGIISACDKSGVKVCIIPYFNDYIPAHPSVDVIGDTKIINIRDIPLDYTLNAFIKRFGDILLSLILIIIFSPIMLVIAIGTKLSSPGPIIFKQERIGLNKKHFYMYKFRSMKINDSSNTAWSKDEDNRKTKFGSFIRKFSLDELPQFFNVLKGDMSLVGPRPEIPYYVNQFKDEIPLYLVRQKVRPGITGLAQVNGYRGDTSIKERINLDIEYIEHWTVWLDIVIIFKTIFGGMINKEVIIK